MKFTLGAMLWLVVATAVLAAPFEERFSFTQPDGTKIELWGKGDEFYADFETLDGFTVVFNHANKTYHYAKLSPDGSELKPVGPPVGKTDPTKLGLTKHQRISKAARQQQVNERFRRWDQEMQITERWTRRKETMRAAEAGAGQTTNDVIMLAPPSSTTTGTKVGLTLLIDFDDDPATIPQASIVDYCNSTNYTGYGNNGSVMKYFLDNSNNLLTYTNVVTVYIRIPNSLHPKSWYNDTTKDCGDQGNLLIEDAITIMKALPNYNTEILPTFSDLTVDGSNRVIAFNVFYAGGNGGVWSMGLWPHSWSLYNVGAQPLGNGKSVWKYQITNIGSSLALGTFCHENGHMLCGFPDIYDYDYDSTGGAGVFCLMNYGGSGGNPKQICAYLKRAAGWATTIELTSASNFVASVSAAGPDFNKFYRYKKPGVNTEYYLVENRQKIGRDSALPAAGVAIWHIDELGNKNNQSTNYNTSHLNYEVSLMQADNLWHFQFNVNSGDSKDLYYLGNTATGYSNVFSDTSAPCARWWDGTPSGISFSGFSATNVTMTFQVGIYSLFVTLPASANEGDGVLTGQGQVSITPTMTTNLTVALTSSDTSEVTVPSSVVIPANQSNVVFNVTIVNDAILDGDQSATVTATASACAPGAASMIVHDNETATLTVAIPTDATEGDGTVSGTVYVSAPVATNVTVTLSSDDTTEATVPANVVVATGATNATFNITIIDDAAMDGPQPVAITAHVQNWTDGVASLTVLDNESTNLVVTLPSVVREGQGVLTNAGNVRISGILGSALTVNLDSSDTSELLVPASVFIAAGGTNALFNVTVVDDRETDGSQPVTVTASAAGFANGSAGTTVLDNDLYRFAWGAISGLQTAGAPFGVTISALSIDSIAISNYAGTASLSGAGNGGPVSLTPTSTGAFSNGLWNGNLTVNTPDTNILLVASDGAGHSGTSTPFTVVIGPVHHFTWSTVSSPQTVGQAFPVTVTAKDAANNTVESFTNSVALSGWQGGTAAGVRISEMFAGTPDAIEFVNVSSSPVDISGWQVFIYDAVSGVNPLPVFTIPAGSICPTGGVFRVTENGTAPGTYPLFYRGANINWVRGSSTLGVLLRDAASNVVDFVAASNLNPTSITNPVVVVPIHWQGSQVASVSSDTYSYQRYGNNDNNTSNDWRQATNNVGTVNSGLMLPFTGGAAAVAIAPTNSGNFVSGVWTGSVAVLQAASNMWLRADDGSGHTGVSSNFQVIAAADLQLCLAATPTTGIVGKQLTYTLNITNAGPSAVTGVVITNALPFTVTNIGNLAAGSNAAVTIFYTPTLDGILTNRASVTALQFDPATNNNVATIFTIVPYDNDGDGIADTWEVAHGFDPANAADAMLDSDGDGQTNLQEFQAGTDPASATNCFRITNSGLVSNSAFLLTFTTVSGKLYRIEYSADITAPSPWPALTTNIPGTGGPITIPDFDAPGQPRRFYRIRLLP